MTANRGQRRYSMINRAFRHGGGVSILSSLLAVLLCLTALPKTARADQAANDADLIDRMNEIVENLAPANPNATDNDAKWMDRLNQRFYKTTQLKTTQTLKWNFDTGVDDGWKWNGKAANGTQATGTGRPNSPNCIPYYDSTSKTYYIWSGEQLLYALNKLGSTNRGTPGAEPGSTVRLMADIDLNGQSGKSRNWPCIVRVDQLTVDGGGHTVFNLRVDHSTSGNSQEYAAWIGKALDFIMQNITFDHANLCGRVTTTPNSPDFTSATGIIGFATTTATTGTTRFYNVGVTNSLMVGTDQVGGMYGRFSTRDMSNKSIIKCFSENNVCFGGSHVGSLGSSTVSVDYIAYCYSVGSVVISTKGHSGGLFSCYGRVDKTAFCFVDAEVYGKVDTGVFTGVVGHKIPPDNPCRIVSCFSSGFVEGRTNIGGFVGSIGTEAATFYEFDDCYSTALAGLRSTGTYLGGFLGQCKETVGPKTQMKNCYAAGEVGYTSLNVADASTEPKAKFIGGMMGDGRIDNYWVNNCFESCYYDKQTTAMREWDVGGKHRAFYKNLTGVLTMDSVENGNGLTNTAPGGGTDGFKGFTADTDSYYPANTGAVAHWDYTAGGHYPELTAFKNATATNWGTQERANLARAYSLSSTATAKLDTWDYKLNKATGKIDVGGQMTALTYDTVRDLTSSFTLTTNLVDSWDRIGDQDNKTHVESKSNIARETLDVLSLKAVGGQYICDELVPGIEWLMVTCSVGDQTATRRIRVIPTASLDAGLNAMITGLYDHADDVKLYYSTGARIENSRGIGTTGEDVTTGIFPDVATPSSPITAEQQKMLNNGGQGHNAYNVSDTQTGNDLYGTATLGASASYMGRSGENAADSAIYVYIYKVDDIDPGTSEILTGDRITLTDTNLSAGAKQFNGYELLENTDQRYLIEYMWELKDGRVLSDAKMVRRAKLPFQVTLNLYQNTISPATLYPDGGYLYTGINAPGGNRLPLTNFSDITTAGLQAATDAGDAEFKETAQTAWKIKNPEETVKQVQLIMQNGDPAIRAGEVFSKTIDNPQPGQTISLPTVRYRIVYRNGGFFTIPEYVTRAYTLQYNAANAAWHLEFKKSNEVSVENPKISFNDVENCITVNVVVHRSADPADGGAADIPQTGDDVPMYLWFGILIIALAGLVIVKYRRTSDGSL